MSHTFASLVIAGLILSAGPYVVTSAQPARHQVTEVEILVSGSSKALFP